MAVLILAVTIGLVMIGLSIRANSRFHTQARLPMQWSLSGSVNWTAPRVVALSFTPALTIVMLTLFVIASRTMQPRQGQEGDVVPALLGMGACFVAAHIFHLWLISRTLRRTGA